MKSGEKNLSERTLPFPSMTMMPRSVDKLPYHAPVTNGEIHPDSNGNKKKKKGKNKKKKNSMDKMNELRELVRSMIMELDKEVRLYSDEPKTVYAFIRGDEVYRVGQTEPFGMVDSLGSKNVMVKRHDDGKIVSVNPDDLYLGKDWHRYNRQANIQKGY